MLLALSLGLRISNSRYFIGRSWRDYAFLLWSTENKPPSSQHGKHFCMARAILYLIPTVYDGKICLSYFAMPIPSGIQVLCESVHLTELAPVKSTAPEHDKA